MNKRTSEFYESQNSRRKALEEELIGNVIDKQEDIDTGKPKVHNPRAVRGESLTNQFQIKQGIRRRHPKRVLHQYQGVAGGTENIESGWEKALMKGQKRATLSDEYKVDSSSMLVNQIGVVSTALDNYKHSKGRFTRTVQVGN